MKLLHSFNVLCILDVRAFPTSKFEHFKAENLKYHLNKEGVEYFYLGAPLGGYRRGGYEEYTKTSAFKEGLKRLESIAQGRRAAVLCCERFPWRCHRRYIGRELQRKGWRVVHIIEEKRTWIPKK
jgi:uncharacterized protein (DUF488 family)